MQRNMPLFEGQSGLFVLGSVLGSGPRASGDRLCSVRLQGQGSLWRHVTAAWGPAAPCPLRGVEGSGGMYPRFRVQGKSVVAARGPFRFLDFFFFLRFFR
jgi:hypothetical protein